MAPYGALADAADPAAAGATSSTRPSEEQPRTAALEGWGVLGERCCLYEVGNMLVEQASCFRG